MGKDLVYSGVLHMYAHPGALLQLLVVKNKIHLGPGAEFLDNRFHRGVLQVYVQPDFLALQ